MHSASPFEIVSFKYFKDEYHKNLKTPSCLPPFIEELCGGWSQETYKQVIQKITKKGSTPLPLYFDSPQSMESMSNKSGALAELFKNMDTLKKGRIDAYEVFSFITFIVNGEFENVFSTVVEIFGTEKPNSITQDEMYYFFDSVFRAMFKLLLKKNSKSTVKTADKRLADEDLKMIVKKLFGDGSITSLLKEEFVANLKKDAELNDVFTELITTMQDHLKKARDQALADMKNKLEIRKIMNEMLVKVEKEFKK
mmetsp:Transcript_21496/g.24968  ORF Transcript_21496/g.24968 Transcript_21496/m.24968 type:complete len:253 (-) Transcript_21496:72-830(-)